MYGEHELLEGDELDFLEEADPDPFSELDYEFEASTLPEPQATLGELEGDEGADFFGDPFGDPFGESLEADEADFEDMFAESDEFGEASYGLDPFEVGLSEAEFGGWIKRAFRKVRNVVKKAVPAIKRVALPMFKKLAPLAAKAVGGVIGGPAGAAIAGRVASAVLREAEIESEAEAGAIIAEGEIEFEQAGGDTDAYELMEVNAAAAASTTSTPAADSAIAKMATAATTMFQGNPRLRPILPDVVKATLTLAMTLQRNPQTRWAVRAVPLIVKRALTRLARTPQLSKRVVIEAVSREIAWVLANRSHAVAALRRHRVSLRRAPLHVRPRQGRRPMRAPMRRPVRPRI